MADYSRVIEIREAAVEERSLAFSQRSTIKRKEGDVPGAIEDIKAVLQLPGLSSEDRVSFTDSNDRCAAWIALEDNLERAGFTIEATSDVLRHPEDDRTKGVFADGMRGATDRFVIRARKPA